MITKDGMQEIASAIAAMVDKGKFLNNGQEIQRPPFRINVEDTKVKVLLYLDDADVGKFENFTIISKSGATLFERPGSIEKTEADGLVVAFSVELQEVEVSVIPT